MEKISKAIGTIVLFAGFYILGISCQYYVPERESWILFAGGLAFLIMGMIAIKHKPK